MIGGLVGMLCLRVPHLLTSAISMVAALCLSTRALLAAGGESADLAKLGLFFVKVGSVLYGSGYVLIAFLEGGLIDDYGWVTRQQLLDAVAAGQFTPGPVLTTATFLGFLIAGPCWRGNSHALHFPARVRVRLDLEPLGAPPAQVSDKRCLLETP